MNKASSSLDGKFALISHVLPPAPSGQSVLLERLLCEMEPDSYCLINSGLVDASSTAGGLAGLSYWLRSPLRLPVLRIPILSSMVMLLNAISGIFSRARQIATIVRSENCDLLIGCTGDLYDLPATWLASRWTGRPFIAYIMDDYIFQWTGFFRWMAKQLEPKFVKAAAEVFVLNEFVRRCYASRYEVQPRIIHNPVCLPNLEQLDQSLTEPEHSRTDIVYTGSIYHAHFDSFQNLIAVLKDFDPDQVQLHIYTSQSRESLANQGINGPGIIYHPHIPQDSVFKVLRQADILFLPLAFDSTIPEVIQSSAPFKTSEYLAVERPILIHSPAGSFLSWYFRENECGLVVDRNDRKLLKHALDELIDDSSLRRNLASNARRRAELDFDIKTTRAVFIEHLNQTMKEKN